MVKFAAIGGQRYVKSVYPDNIGAVYTEKLDDNKKSLDIEELLYAGYV